MKAASKITEALLIEYSDYEGDSESVDPEAMEEAIQSLIVKGVILDASPGQIDWAKIGARGMHPTRRAILDYLGRVPMGSPTEIAGLLGEALGNVSYHVKELFEPTNPKKNPSFIELVKTEPRRGAVEHYYRRRPEPVFADQPKATA